MKYSEYEKRRDEFCKIREDSLDSLDKAIMTLSTGALALSLAFIEKVGRPYDSLSTFLIISCWVCWGLVITVHLFSFQFAKNNMDKKIYDLDNQYSNYLETKKPVKETTFPEKRYTELCNTSAIVLFMFGTMFFITYTVMSQCHYSLNPKQCNTTGGNQMSEMQKKTTEIQLTDSKKDETPKRFIRHDGKTETSMPVLKEATAAKTETSPPITKPTQDIKTESPVKK